jgi:hypothetical protein
MRLKLHPLSFGLGIASGVIVLLLVVFTMRMVGGNRYGARNFGGNGGPNIARMAERFNMTEADLQKEIDSGKTMQEIAAEHGAQFGGGRGFGNASAGSSVSMSSVSSVSSLSSSSAQ